MQRAARAYFIELALLLFGVLFAVDALSLAKPRLIVYLHGNVKPHALQTALADRMPDTDVIVLGRHRDFQRELEGHPDAVLAIEPVLAFHGLKADLQGVYAGRDTERYVLLSVGATIPRERFPSLTVGTIDLLGRDATAKFVARVLELSTPPQIKYVVKAQDLLSLLQFESADAVLVSERQAEGVKSLSKRDLRTTPLDARVGLAAVAFRSDTARRSIRPSIRALDADTMRKLGLEGWR